MRKKWKCLSSLGLAALLACMVPMSTMKAAEDTTSVSENSIDTELQEGQDYDADQSDGVPVAEGFAETIEINIQYNGDMKGSLTGAVDFNNFTNELNPHIGISASSGGSVSLFYCLDITGDVTDKSNEELAGLDWIPVEGTYYEVELSEDGKYVLYVKAVQDGQTAYARSKGIVVDRVAPKVVTLDGTEMKDGDSYPEGTEFRVEEKYLKEIVINDEPVSVSEKYMIVAKGPECGIKIEDEAGNRTELKIVVTDGSEKPGGDEKPDEDNKPGEGENPDEGDKPGDDIGVITESGIYPLYAGTAYQLGGGNWKVDGDSTVYQGGIAFYVSVDGNYQFNKR